MQRILCAAQFVGEKVDGIHFRVAEILERRAMKLVGAALGHDVHLRAGASSELGSGHAGLHRKLLHGVRDPKGVGRSVNIHVHIAHPIQQRDVGLRACTRNVEASTLYAYGSGQNSRR